MRRRVVAAIAALTATLLLLTAIRASAHPLHTTLTEISVDASTRALRADVRIFADDLARTLGRRNADADIETYVRASVAFIDEHNRPLVLRGCGIRHSGELVWVCVQAEGTARVSFRNSLLCEQFKDQINIVQVAFAGTKRGLVFTRGDGPKRLF